MNIGAVYAPFFFFYYSASSGFKKNDMMREFFCVCVGSIILVSMEACDVSI